MRSASTTTDARIHANLGTLLYQLYEISVDHVGDPSGEDQRTIVGVRDVLCALLFRIAWRDHRIDGNILQWTLRDLVETEERPSPISTNLRRPLSPTSSVGQGRAKRQRMNNEAPPQGMVQDGLGGTESDPIDVDGITVPSLKRSSRLSSTLPSLHLTGGKRFNPLIGFQNVSTSKSGVSNKTSLQRSVHISSIQV